MLSQIDKNYLELFKTKYVYNCPVCQGRDSFCDCWRRYNAEIKKVSANIPVRYRHYTLSDFTHPQLSKQKVYIENQIKDLDNTRLNGKTLFFYGTSGTAKTMSAILIACEAINRGYKVYYFESLQNIATMLKQSWASESTDEFTEKIISSDLIIVDNLGSENIPNDNVRQEILNMFNQRSYNCLPTICISPVSIESLPQLSKDLVEGLSVNGIEITQFKGFDYRKKVLERK